MIYTHTEHMYAYRCFVQTELSISMPLVGHTRKMCMHMHARACLGSSMPRRRWTQGSRRRPKPQGAHQKFDMSQNINTKHETRDTCTLALAHTHAHTHTSTHTSPQDTHTHTRTHRATHTYTQSHTHTVCLSR